MTQSSAIFADGESTPVLLPEYEQWLERLSATHDALVFCCFHRLHNRGAAERVGVDVVAGLLKSPTVFQYFGLPFAGRLAHLAEPLIAEAKRTARTEGATWQDLRARLLQMPAEHQRVFVLAFVAGCDDAAIASSLGCDEDTARQQRERVADLVRNLAEEGQVPPSLPSA